MPTNFMVQIVKDSVTITSFYFNEVYGQMIFKLNDKTKRYEMNGSDLFFIYIGPKFCCCTIENEKHIILARINLSFIVVDDTMPEYYNVSKIFSAISPPCLVLFDE